MVGRHFVRNPEVREWVRAFLVAGCELGLHNDCLGAYTRWGADGADLLVRELEWLRGEGVQIRGTVAHNSGPTYGAENFEIFEGMVLWDREVVTDSGARIPLGCLDMQGLGLTYEGVFARPKGTADPVAASAFFSDRRAASLRSREWMTAYLCNNPAMHYLIDWQAWLVGPDTWVATSHAESGRVELHWDVSGREILELLEAMPAGRRGVLVLHPEYFRGHSDETDRAEEDR